jgi:penicillin amidase
MRRTILVISAWALLTSLAAAHGPNANPPSKLAGLQAAAQVSRDTYGIAHVKAGNDHDLYFMQGYVHAQDRLFQMDYNRRQASGTLAELLGPAALPADVELRTIGIRRAAQRSLDVISPEARAAIEAYAEGVNAYVASLTQLPPEYGALEITKFQPWTALDSLAVAKSLTFGLSFNLDDIANTIAVQTYSMVFGQGTGATLFSEDLWRSQPFYLASTVPDASVGMPPRPHGHAPGHAHRAEGAAAELGRIYLDRVRDMPFFKRRLDRDNRPGSNQ